MGLSIHMLIPPTSSDLCQVYAAFNVSYSDTSQVTIKVIYVAHFSNALKRKWPTPIRIEMQSPDGCNIDITA